VVLFPGGFGTHDEGFEALTLIQTGKAEMVPVVYVDEPGGSYWKDWKAYVQSHLRTRGLISENDFSLFKVTDDVDEAVAELLQFYRNYHSSRYVRDRLVLRVVRAPDEEELEALNNDFSDLLASGRIEVSDALPEENGEMRGYPRVVLHFNRHGLGRLRQFIDRLNELSIPDAVSIDAAPHQIVEQELSPEAEAEEQDDDDSPLPKSA